VSKEPKLRWWGPGRRTGFTPAWAGGRLLAPTAGWTDHGEGTPRRLTLVRNRRAIIKRNPDWVARKATSPPPTCMGSKALLPTGNPPFPNGQPSGGKWAHRNQVAPMVPARRFIRAGETAPPPRSRSPLLSALTRHNCRPWTRSWTIARDERVSFMEKRRWQRDFRTVVCRARRRLRSEFGRSSLKDCGAVGEASSGGSGQVLELRRRSAPPPPCPRGLGGSVGPGQVFAEFRGAGRLRTAR